MFSKKELEGLVLQGYFGRNSENAQGRQDSANKQHPFKVEILHYNAETGGFIARGNDFFGESGLVGTISEDEIEFTKVYIGKEPIHLRQHDASRFHEIFYKGQIVKPDAIITCGGEYKPPRGWNENYGGTWRLDSQPSQPTE